MAKRLAIAAFDALSAFVVACVLLPATATPAYAYIDPSVMTYTIQAVAGVAVALSAVAGVALRRGRKMLMRILDIDENSKKEFETDVHRTADFEASPEHPVGAQQAGAVPEHPVGAQQAGAAPEHPVGAQQAGAAPEHPVGAQQAGAAPEHPVGAHSVRPASEANAGDSPVEPTPQPTQSPQLKPSMTRAKAYKPTWKERLAYALIAAFFFTFTIYFTAPLEIVAGASEDLVYSMGDVWWTLLLPDLGIIAGIALVLTLLRGRAFNIGLALVFAVGLCAYVQALFLNVGLPAANGDTIAWADYMSMQIISTIVWLAIIAGALVFAILRSRRSQGVVAIVAVCLVIVQGVGLVSLVFTPAASGEAEASDAKVVMTEDQMYTVNPNHNVVVFILDTYDTAYLKRILRDFDPDLLDGFDGFTNYENATSAMIPTRFAIPEMLTGQMPSFDETYETYAAERYERSDFLQSIYDANYSIGLYTDSMRISSLSPEEQRSITSKTVNMHSLPDSMMDYWGCVYSLYQMGQYRDVLWPFKWAFWYYTDQINRAIVQSDEATAPDETIYVMDDVRYYNRLSEFGLSLEDGDYDGAFRFIHLLGSHYPFSYDEEAKFIGDDESNVFRQSQGALHIMKTYIAQLKELGVYENTTIIITADHGYWTITLDPIEETSTPIMFVKPAQSAELDALPMATDEKPVSHLDLQATVLDAMGLDYSEYSSREEWAGYSMLRDIPDDRVRHYLTTDSEPDLTAVRFREYEIVGNALDWANWHETGRFIEPIEQS